MAPHHFPHHLPLSSQSKSWFSPSLIALNLLAIAALCLVSWGIWQQHAYYQTRFLPGTTIDGVSVAHLTELEASSQLSTTLPPLPEKITLVTEVASSSSSSADLGIYRDIAAGVQAARLQTTQLPLTTRLLGALRLVNVPVGAASPVKWDERATTFMIADLAQKLDQPAETATITLTQSGVATSLQAKPGKPGQTLEQTLTKEVLADLLAKPAQRQASELTLQAPIVTTGTTITEEQQNQLLERAKSLVGKQLNLTSSDFSLKVSDQDLVTLLGYQANLNPEEGSKLLSSWTARINREPQNARFEYDPQTLQVSVFEPPREGLQFSQTEFLAELPTHLTKLESAPAKTIETASLPVETTAPSQTLAATNNLGIKELIGSGDSEYDHSIPSRIHNVSLTASKINNFIVKPGEEFSFNKALGEVSSATGFLPAYVIKGGQTVLGDGGGVCQVSTTLFRALLDGGLKITKRRPHSYRVSYYELNRQAGFDATVYSGDVDLRFVNDTDGHILIHTMADSKDLYMKVELYGTSDGRTAEVVDYKSWDFRPAPAPVYFPDATLPPGKLVQIDWATSGIKTSFKNVIKDKTGSVIREDVYTSNYIPWSAKYRQGV